MIRQPTLVAFALCAVLGVSLFLVKYDVQSLEEQLVKIDRQAAADQEAIHVLKAEWSFLTQPARLAGLSERHLPLHPLTANQIGDFDQLALREDHPAGPQIPAADKDVPVESVLQAMQLADYKPAAAKPRAVR
jgi:hypothetical protein